MQHGDFTWIFNNSVQDENYNVIDELTSALLNYKSTLVGFFDGTSISNGGATTTVDGGDGKGLTEEQQNSYVPSWAGGGGGVLSADFPDPNFCGPETESGSKVYDYLWFNADNKTKIEGFIADGLLTYSDEASFNATRELKSSDGTVVSKYTGSLQLPQSNGTATFKCVNGVSSIAFAIFRTGNAKGEIQVSKDGTTFTKIRDYSANKGDATVTASTSDYATGPVWVRITNKATGALHITGVKMMYPDPNGGWIDDPGTDDPEQSSDASADFTIDGSAVSFTNNSTTVSLAYDDPATSVTIVVEPAEGATITSVTGATGSGNTYTIAAPAEGQSTTATFVITAENGTTTKTYTVIVEREVKTAIETGVVNLQSNNVPAGFKLDGSSSVTAYTYSSDLCNNANLIKVTAGQHIVTVPTGAVVTKIVMYAVGDNNTANKGKITELAGQEFSIDLPSRKTGTALATATVDNVSITQQFTFTVTYAAGVKFQLTVQEATDGINNVNGSLNDNGIIYDLMGRRVTVPQPGQVYIKGGKKFIVR